MNTFFKTTIVSIFMVITVSLASADLVIDQGKRVTINYILSINSEPVETTQGKEPLTFVVGSKSIIPGLENQLMGMSVGQEKKIIVDANEAYGPIDPGAFKEVPRSAMPQDTELKPGVVVEVEDPQGGLFPGVVWEIKADSVILNFNHPLAGQTLEFDVKVLDIQ